MFNFSFDYILNVSISVKVCLHFKQYINFSAASCPFNYTAIAVSGKAGTTSTRVTTQVGWLLLLQLTVQSRSAIIMQSTFWWRFGVVFGFLIFFIPSESICDTRQWHSSVTKSGGAQFFLPIVKRKTKPSRRRGIGQ